MVAKLQGSNKCFNYTAYIVVQFAIWCFERLQETTHARGPWVQYPTSRTNRVPTHDCTPRLTQHVLPFLPAHPPHILVCSRVRLNPLQLVLQRMSVQDRCRRPAFIPLRSSLSFVAPVAQIHGQSLTLKVHLQPIRPQFRSPPTLSLSYALCVSPCVHVQDGVRLTWARRNCHIRNPPLHLDYSPPAQWPPDYATIITLCVKDTTVERTFHYYSSCTENA